MTILRYARARIAVRLARGAGPLTAPSAPPPYDPKGEYLDFSSEPMFDTEEAHYALDDDGIPIVKYGEIWAQNPVFTAIFGLQEFSKWGAQHNPENLANAERAGRWLCDTQNSETGAWLYEFDFPVPGTGSTLKAPWPSAMAQGQAMSLLTRLHRTTDVERYDAAARAALPVLDRKVSDGGLRQDLFGHPYYEEYPTQPPSFTLNGFMFSLLGLYDLAVCGDDQAQALFDAGIESLVCCLPFYDSERISAYHLAHITQSPREAHRRMYYHWLHVKLLWALDSIWHHETLEFYAKRWNR